MARAHATRSTVRQRSTWSQRHPLRVIGRAVRLVAEAPAGDRRPVQDGDVVEPVAARRLLGLPDLRPDAREAVDARVVARLLGELAQRAVRPGPRRTRGRRRATSRHRRRDRPCGVGRAARRRPPRTRRRPRAGSAARRRRPPRDRPSSARGARRGTAGPGLATRGRGRPSRGPSSHGCHRARRGAARPARTAAADRGRPARGARPGPCSRTGRASRVRMRRGSRRRDSWTAQVGVDRARGQPRRDQGPVEPLAGERVEEPGRVADHEPASPGATSRDAAAQRAGARRWRRSPAPCATPRGLRGAAGSVRAPRPSSPRRPTRASRVAPAPLR